MTEENKQVNFYQWVTFMLLINAAIFRIPYIIWKFCEGGLMKSFYSRKKDEDPMRGKAIFFNQLRGQMNWYYITFLSCEILNVGMLVINWISTDRFLNGEFHTYGLRVMHYLSLGTSEQTKSFNPMCNAFPTTVSHN